MSTNNNNNAKTAKRAARRRRSRKEQSQDGRPAKRGNEGDGGWSKRGKNGGGRGGQKAGRGSAPPRLFIRVVQGQAGAVAYQAKIALSDEPTSLSSLAGAARLPTRLTVVRLSVWPKSSPFTVTTAAGLTVEGTNGEVVAHVLSHAATYTGSKGAYLLITFQTPEGVAPIGRTDTSATYYAPTLNPKRSTVTKTVTQATITNRGEFKDYHILGIDRLGNAPAILGTLSPPDVDGPWHFIPAFAPNPYDGARVRFQVAKEAKESRYVIKLKKRPVQQPSRSLQEGL